MYKVEKIKVNVNQGKFLPHIKIRHAFFKVFLCVSFDVMYSGEYNVFDAIL